MDKVECIVVGAGVVGLRRHQEAVIRVIAASFYVGRTRTLVEGSKPWYKKQQCEVKFAINYKGLGTHPRIP